MSMLSVYYIKHNYMFRPLMLAIFRLYMNTYKIVIQPIRRLFLGEGGVVQVHNSSTPKNNPHIVCVTTWYVFTYNLKMGNINGQNMWLCLM